MTNIRGNAWVFGDDINTDDMYPGFAMKLPMPEAAQYIFDASRPGWAASVERGDMVVAGRNFGLGSSRPVPELLVELGVSCLIAEQFNSLFLRNALNYGLAAITLPIARDVINEGDILQINLDQSTILNETRGEIHGFQPFPPFILEILKAGGLTNQLEAAGLLRASPITARHS